MRDVHSLKYRVKEPSHLRGKLIRKLLSAKSNGYAFSVKPDNLFEKINDLAGLRILHLHTMQIRTIHERLMDLFEEQRYRLIEEPTANCWDVEFENLFKGFGIATKSRDSMYTTIHYVLEANQRSKLTCEIQVRSLMDEVWGEVSHMVNYPHESPSQTCQDQLKVLARLTSGGVRLVDSVFGALERNER
jgi:ppGpp synthetase/RelA/SpoT-type nucleotidyltranferase